MHAFFDQPPTMTERRHDIDALRIFTFALLILYHVGMAYVADWDFHLKSVHTAEWLQWPMIVLNRWRMPLLFMISGIAIGLSRPQATPWRFALRRCGRLLPPLLFGMFVVVAVQAYCQGVSNGKVATGFGSFLLRYWQVRPWPAGSFDGWKHGITWNHLWYLAYLLPYTAALMVLVSLSKLLRLPALPRLPSSVVVPALLVVPILWEAFCVMWVMPRHPPTHALVGDWFMHAESFPLFFIGLSAGTQRALLAAGRATALAHAGSRGADHRNRAGHSLSGHARAARAVAAGAGRPAMGNTGTRRTRGLHLAGAADSAGLGEAAFEPPVPLAAVLHRSGVPLVHPASEPDHRDAVLADAVAVERLAGTGTGDCRHSDRLSGTA